MKFNELLDPIKPEKLPELKEEKMPEESYRRVRKLVNDQTKPAKKHLWNRIAPFAAVAAAVCGLVIGLRIATLPDRNIAQVEPGTASGNVNDDAQATLQPETVPTTAEEKPITLEKITVQNKNSVLTFKVNCPEVAYWVILHGGMELKQGENIIWSSKGADINDQKAIELAILSADVLTGVEPGVTTFDFEVRIDRGVLSNGSYTFTINSLYSADLEYDSDGNVQLPTDKIYDKVEIPFSISAEIVTGE